MAPFSLKSSRIRTRCPDVHPGYNIALCWYPQTHKVFWEYAVHCLLFQTLGFSLCTDILLCHCSHVTTPLCKGVGGIRTRVHTRARAHAHTHSCSASKENKKGQETTPTHSLDKKEVFQVALKGKTQLSTSEKADPKPWCLANHLSPHLPSSSHSWYGRRQPDHFYIHFRSRHEGHYSPCGISSAVSCCYWKDAEVSSKEVGGGVVLAQDRR